MFGRTKVQGLIHSGTYFGAGQFVDEWLYTCHSLGEQWWNGRGHHAQVLWVSHQKHEADERIGTPRHERWYCETLGYLKTKINHKKIKDLPCIFIWKRENEDAFLGYFFSEELWKAELYSCTRNLDLCPTHSEGLPNHLSFFIDIGGHMISGQLNIMF